MEPKFSVGEEVILESVVNSGSDGVYIIEAIAPHHGVDPWTKHPLVKSTKWLYKLEGLVYKDTWGDGIAVRETSLRKKYPPQETSQFSFEELKDKLKDGSLEPLVIEGLEEESVV